MSTVFTKVRHTLRRWLKGPHADLGFRPQPDFYYLASFPKSGNTWVRFLLANLLAGRELELQGFGRYVPDSHIKGDLAYMADPTTPFNQMRPRFVKTHLYYRPIFRRAIYIVRDGRDAMTSFYHWRNRRSGKPVSLREIIVGETYWGRWSDHVLGWLNSGCELLVVKYEDLYADTAGQLRRILDFCHLHASEEQIAAAVAASSFERMRAKEKAAQGAETPLFVRKGGSGDWRNLFSPADEDLFWQYHRAGMIAAGYGDRVS
ncbi:sulfotransferase domain-containing protein [Chloroflexus sp. Y-396-1]|uniref:sulfotransferase domain-containing protein n=1 Tax=Chloroflexus sp. Y-396-1 TaxID=867845 RepID=UPI00048B58CB|nr:sulfotransferase domain-containing protein [Chloroflexus sp. Y-396-1]